MAQTNLREYIRKLNTLLEQGKSTEEVIHHCRHILQHFPRSVETYRVLGRALVQQNRWQEAAEIFRRILAVYPLDFEAHNTLGQIYATLEDMKHAIWHTERAFEQQPNDEEVIKRLREWYAEYHNVHVDKIQLTAAAVAQQHIRNGLYERALDVLTQALDKSSQRVDLRLLLAMTLWGAGHLVDAGEVALSVLKDLPDCLDANEIMVMLWLGEKRPSDAQRYLNRIEAVDPYIARELATGQAAPDDLVRLDELDYEKVAQHELTAESPDWFADLGEDLDISDSGQEDAFDAMFDETDDENWLEDDDLGTAFDIQEIDEEEPSLEDLFGDDEEEELPPEEWLAELAEDSEIEEAPEGERTPTGLTGLLSSLDDDEDDDNWLADIEESGQEALQQQRTPTGLTGLLSSLDDDEEDDWLAEVAELDDLDVDAIAQPAENTPAHEEQQRTSTGRTGLLSELDEEEDDFLEEVDFRELFPEEQADAQPQTTEAHPDTSELPSSDSEDPLAWMKEAGIELVEDDEEPELFDPYGVDDGGELQPLDEVDPLAWARSSGIEIEEEPAAPVQDEKDGIIFEEDPLAWMKEAGIELVEDDEEEQAEEEFTPPQTSSDTADATAQFDHPQEDAGLAWLEDDELLEEMLDVESLTEEQAPRESLERGEWVEENDDDFAPNGEAALFREEEGDDNFDWLAESEEIASQEEASEEEDLFPEPQAQQDADWLTDDPFEEMSLETTDAPIGAGLEWLEETEVFPQSEEQSEPDTQLDWVEEGAPQATTEDDLFTDGDDEGGEWVEEDHSTEQAQTVEDAMSADELFDDADLEWLSEVDEEQPESHPQTQPADDLFADGDDALDWMADDEEAQLTQPADNLFADDDDALDWMADDKEAQLTQPADDLFADDDDALDWMADDEEAQLTQPADDLFAESENEEDALDWLASSEEEISEDVVEAAQPSDDLPDWLAEAAPQSEVPQEVEDALDWMADVEPELEAKSAVNEHDDFFGDEELGWDEEAEDEALADTPDWLSNIGAVAAAAAEESEETWLDNDAEYDWSQDAEEPLAAEEDWLAELSVSDDEPAPQTEALADDPDWLSEVVEDKEAAYEEDPLISGDAPDWLADVGAIETEEQAPSEAEASSEWFAEDEEDDQFQWDLDAETLTDDEPDWLAAIGEGSEEGEAEPAMIEEDGAADWLSSIGEEESDEPIAEATDIPDWLAAAAPNENEENALLEEAEDDWLADISYEEEPEESAVEMSIEEEIDPAPASNAPDWLNAMVPGLNVDYEAPEDMPVEREYIDEPIGHRPMSSQADEDSGKLDWLHKIVAEESGEAAETNAQERREFRFTRPPLWARNPPATVPAPAMPTLTLGEYGELPVEASATGYRDDEDDIDLFEDFDDGSLDELNELDDLAFEDYDDDFDEFDPDFLKD